MTRLPLDAYYRDPYPLAPFTCPRCGGIIATLGAARLHIDRRRRPEDRLAFHLGFGLIPDRNTIILDGPWRGYTVGARDYELSTRDGAA